jgi:hypothetical protein
VAPPAPKKPAAPKGPPSLDQWLAGDTAYKQQMDAAAKASADYVTQMTGQQNAYNTEYTRNMRNLNDQEKVDGRNATDDFAARGMMNSGLFIKDATDRTTDYNKRESTLNDGKSEFIANLGFGRTNFDSTQNLNKQRYRNEAIQRRAAKYNL